MPACKKSGFTLIEIMIALVILTIGALGLASATGGFVRNVAMGDLRSSAIQLADDKVAEARMTPNYDSLTVWLAGSESDFPTLDGFTRVTTVNRIGGPSSTVDHTKITVTVNGPGLDEAVVRTVTLAAP